MGGKNRTKKKISINGSTSTKKSSSVKVSNKQSNKAKKQAGLKEAEKQGKNVVEKKSQRTAVKAEKQAARRAGGAGGIRDGENAESRKKAKRSHGAKSSGAPSIKQQKQHSHEPHAMARHDEAYNKRQQAKAEKHAARENGTAVEGEDGAGADDEDNVEPEPEANEADMRFFDKHSQMAGFLNHMDADSLKESKESLSKPKPKFPQPAPGTKKRKFEDEEEEEDEDDEDDDDLDEEDDEEADLPASASASSSKPARGINDYEKRPRVASWSVDDHKNTAKDRMPVRNADGSWGISAVSKYDLLKERAAKLEQQAANGINGLKVQSGEQKEDDDEEQLNEDADASEEDEDGDEKMDDVGDDDNEADLDAEEAFDDSIPYVDEDDSISMDDDELDMDPEEDDELDAIAKKNANGQAVEKEKKASISAKEQVERRQFRLKSELAESSELILENPEKHIGKLEVMLQLCTDVDTVLQQYAFMSCVEVLVDLMPTYRIRLPTPEEENDQKKLSKEVEKTWKYERSYLLYYGRLVNLLITYISKLFPKQSNDRPDISKLQLNIMKCTCKLLEKGYAFNYRKELIHALTHFLNHISPAIRLLLFQTLVSIFRADIPGDTTLEIIRILTKIVKEKGRRCHTEVMQIFLYLPLDKEILEAKTGEEGKDKDKDGKGKKNQPVSGKKKKIVHVRVDEKEMHRDLLESEATVSIITRKKIQTQLLTELFTAYFRILKQTKTSKLLPIVLKGISKYATLIDIEIVLDLLDCLKATIQNGDAAENASDSGADDQLSVESSLYCILTSFQTLKSHGAALNMDLKEFYNCLYSLLFKFINPSETQYIPLLLQCIHMMFHETKQLSLERVAAFVKRLAVLTLYVPSYAALSIMHAIKLCLNKYTKVKQLLDREATASGLHLAEIDDPDLANSFASTLWELGLIKTSYHPFLPVYAHSILIDEPLPLSLQRTSPQDLFEAYDTSEGGFNPPLALPILFSTSGGANTKTSASMKKKLDLKRRIQVQQLAVSMKNESFQSSFLKEMTREARKTYRSISGEEKSLEQLQRRSEQLRKYVKEAHARHQKQPKQLTTSPSIATSPSTTTTTTTSTSHKKNPRQPLKKRQKR